MPDADVAEALRVLKRHSYPIVYVEEHISLKKDLELYRDFCTRAIDIDYVLDCDTPSPGSPCFFCFSEEEYHKDDCLLFQAANKIGFTGFFGESEYKEFHSEND